MTLHNPLSPPHGALPGPGAATVGDIRRMDGAQALAVMLLRDWFDGPDGRGRVARTFERALGPLAGPAAHQAWSEVMDVLSRDVRRPVMRHALSCRRVGADEAVIAHVLALAARGEREDAMLILSLLVPGDRLILTIHAAERAGLALMRVALRDRRALRDRMPAPTRFH